MSSSNPPNNSDVSNDNSNNIQGTSINSSHHYKFEGIDVKDHASFRLGNPPSLKSSATSIEDGSHIRISEGEGEGEGENGAQGRNTSTKASGVSEVDNPLPFRDDPSPPSHPQKKDIPPSWSSLPHKGQLVILTLARLSEPLTDTSLQAYMFYQLKSFNPELPDSTISTRAGALQVCFTAAQFVTAVFWGRAADSERCGRKRVLLIGLLGTCLSCVGFGFSRSFIQAAIFRSIGGALNGNVGVLRTMIAEIIKEKK
ncbi:MAG: hypothetical protein M1834_006513 [Cirrosporium novae-zelandiae]|nr:MAG: hypothetical protein M1834_006513 [Cirrosporium novae-zelandiae]